MTRLPLSLVLSVAALATGVASAAAAPSTPAAYRLVSATVSTDYTYSGAVGDNNPVPASGSERARLNLVRPSSPNRYGSWEVDLKGPVTGVFDRVTPGPAHCETSFEASGLLLSLGVNLVPKGPRTLVQFGMSPRGASESIPRIKGECVGSGPLLVCGCPADDGLTHSVMILPADHQNDPKCDGVPHWCISVPTARTRSRVWTATIVRSITMKDNRQQWGANSGTETYSWTIQVKLKRVSR
jgi:hypothetical protein